MELSRGLEPFDPTLEQIDDYKERFDYFCIAHGITEGKQKALFLTRIGQTMYLKLKTWVSPKKLSELSLDEIVAQLKSQTSAAIVEIAERYRFFKRLQRDDEGVVEYMSQLRSLAKTCKFEAYLDTALRDQFVCGLKDQRIQQELLCISDLTLAKALDKSRSMEVVHKETQSIREIGNPTAESKLDDAAAHRVFASKNKDSCYRCGGTGHSASTCFHKDKTCNSCGKLGHLSRVCRSKLSAGRHKGDTRHAARKAHLVEPDEDLSDCQTSDEEAPVCVHRVANRDRYPKLTADLDINGSKVKFEVDTGAEVSTIPARTYRQKLKQVNLQPTSIVLRQYDGTILPTLGELRARVSIENQSAEGCFIVVENADKQLPLLGRDLLCKLRLDWSKMLRSNKADSSRIHAIHSVNLLNEFPDVMDEKLGLLKGTKAEIQLKEGTVPVFCKYRPVPFALREQVEEMIRQQVKEGELEPVERSDWAAPIVIARKKDGNIRICADFKMTINPHLCPKTFPLPTVDEMFSTLAGGESFSKIDLARAYKQMEVLESHRPLLTINTHLGLFRYCRLPFGIATAPAMWQKAMSLVLQGCKKVVYYMDDILVTGKTRQQHEQNLRAVFQRLQQYGLRVNLPKCRFFQESLEFLGHNVSSEGIRPTKERVEGIQNAAVPRNKSELKSFLGLMTYNARFLPALSSVLHRLYQLLKKDEKWGWTACHEKAFKEAKRLVCEVVTLVHYDVEKPVKVYCDASSYGVGACLVHVIGGQEKPIAYASRTLSQAEMKYAQIEREALAIVFAVKKFHQYVYGREFVLVTDHKPLCTIFGHDKGIPTLAAARMQRWAIILGAYQYKIEYIPGSENVCADCMSRLPAQATVAKGNDILAMDVSSLPVTATDISKGTRTDKDLSTVLQFVRHGKWPSSLAESYKPYFRRQNELSCQDDCLLWGQRVIIPKSLRHKLLEELHQGHIGISRMKALARSYIWWPELDKDIEDLAASCDQCKRVASMPELAPRHPWQYPSAPWDRVHVDFGEWNKRHFLVMVDAYSKWPEVRVMSSTTSQYTIEVMQDIFATHGFPRILVSDNGPQFTSKEFSEYLAHNRVLHRRSAPYHPSTNGLAENMVKNVKQWLSKQNWDVRVGVSLSEFLRTYRNVPHSTTGRSPAQIVFGRALRTRLSFVLPCMSERVREQLQPQEGLPVPRLFIPGARVWIRDFRPNAPYKWMPGTILSTVGPLHYTVSTQGGSQRKVHVDHLLSRSESLVQDFPDVPQETTDVTEQFDPCTTRKPLTPLQGNTQPRAAQQETTDVTTTGPPGSDLQPRSSLGRTVEKTRDIGRPETGTTGTRGIGGPETDTTGTTQESHMSPPRRHSTRPSRPPRRLIEEL
eukprot:Em0024g191a